MQKMPEIQIRQKIQEVQDNWQYKKQVCKQYSKSKNIRIYNHTKSTKHITEIQKMPENTIKRKTTMNTGTTRIQQ